MVSNVVSVAKRYGEYGANFLLGTGSTTVGKSIAESIKARKTNNVSLLKSFGKGMTDGFTKSNAEMVQAGGFFKSMKKAFGQLPANMKAGWETGTGKNAVTKFFSSLGKSLKPLGKMMPFAMNALWMLQFIPDIVQRTKDEGIWGGIKETGKSLANMGVISLAAGIGASFGLGWGLILPLVAGTLTNAILGSSYRDKKAAAEAAKQEAQAANNPFIQNPQVGQRLDITSRV